MNEIDGGDRVGIEREITCVGRLRDYPEAIGDLKALLDESGPHVTVDSWLWCERCERTYPLGDLRVVKTGSGWTYYEWALQCADEECEGRRADWYPWHPQELPRAIHREYPDRPDAFVRYRL